MSAKHKRSLLWLTVALPALANLVVWGYVFIKGQGVTKIQDQGKSRGIFDKGIHLPSFNLKNFKGNPVNSRHIGAELTVLIFFSLEDCPICLYEADSWSEAAAAFAGYHVDFYGVVNEKDKKVMDKFVGEYGITFPILIDIDNGLKEKILLKPGVSQITATTPFKVFVNKDGLIVHVEGPTKDPQKQRLFVVRVGRVLDLCRSGGQEDVKDVKKTGRL